MKLFQTYIWPYVKQFKRLMLLTILLGTITVLVSSMLTFASGYLITSASEMPVTIMLLYVPIVAVRTFGISRAVSRYLERLIGHNAVLKILADMRVNLYRLLEPQALFIRSRFQTGDLLGTLADDIEHLQDVYIRTIFPTIIGLFLFAYTITMLSLYDWLFAIWMAFCLSIIVFVYPLVSLYMLKKQQRELKKIKSRLYQTFSDAVFGLSDWIISGKKEQFISRFLTGSKESHLVEKKLSHWNQTRTFQLHVISGLILVMVGIWAGHTAQYGNIMPTYIASFTLVTLPILEGMLPLSQAIERIPTYHESLNRIESIRKYVHEEKKCYDVPLTIQPDIKLENVYYQYENESSEALRDIVLNISHGEKIAILGKSGAGKSTLLQLLQGAITASSGSTSIGGYKPEEFGDNIYDFISVLNQKPYLFATTVENNIRLGNKTATKEEIEQVIKQVKLDQYIHSLPKGLQTQMEETGQRFSGGERQRIALARILLKNTPIVILDEPTVGLDPKTELDLLDTIYDVLKEKTIIIVTHHLIGMEKMDQIVFLDQGQIVMRGTHQQLLATNERYRQLYLLDRGEG